MFGKIYKYEFRSGMDIKACLVKLKSAGNLELRPFSPWLMPGYRAGFPEGRLNGKARLDKTPEIKNCRFRLRRKIDGYRYTPTFFGKMTREGAETTISGRFSIELFDVAFTVVWFGGILLSSAALIYGFMLSRNVMLLRTSLYLIPMLILGIVLLFKTNKVSPEDERVILESIATSLEATTIEIPASNLTFASKVR